MKLTTSIAADRSAWFLILSNVATIAFALFQQWDVALLLWIYWGQSVVIGYFNVRRMLALKAFSTENFRINNQAVAPTRETQRKTAGFFALHYGFFHLVYAIFLLADHSLTTTLSLLSATAGILVFFFNHRFSYRYNLEKDLARVPNIGTMMFFPYLRIVPMHLMIIFGSGIAGGSTAKLLLFLVLKTIADVIMHLIEHAGSTAAVLRGNTDSNT